MARVEPLSRRRAWTGKRGVSQDGPSGAEKSRAVEAHLVKARSVERVVARLA